MIQNKYYNLYMFAGDSGTITFILKDVEGNPLDLSNYTNVEFIVKRNKEDSDDKALYVNKIPTTEIEDAKVVFAFAPGQTAGISGDLWYSLRLTKAPDVCDTLIVSKFTVYEGVFDVE